MFHFYLFIYLFIYFLQDEDDVISTKQIEPEEKIISAEETGILEKKCTEEIL